MHVSPRRLTPIAKPTRIESHDAKERARAVQSHWALVSTFDDKTSQTESRLTLRLALRAWKSRLGFEQATDTPGFARSFLPPPPNNGTQTQRQAHPIPALSGTPVRPPRPPRVPGPGHAPPRHPPPPPRGPGKNTGLAAAAAFLLSCTTYTTYCVIRVHPSLHHPLHRRTRCLGRKAGVLTRRCFTCQVTRLTGKNVGNQLNYDSICHETTYV